MTLPIDNVRQLSTGSQIVRPYEVKNDALSRCELNPGLDEPMSSDGWYVEDEDVAHGLHINSVFRPDWESICQISGAHRSELRLSVQLRKDRARIFDVLGQWQADAHPEQWETTLPEGLGADFRIIIEVTLPRRLSVLPNRPFRSGSVIATRDFSFSSRGYLLNIQFANFVEQGWEADALWHIDIESTNDRPKEGVKIHLNQLVKKYYDEHSSVPQSAKRTFHEIVTAGIFTDLALETLRQGDLELDDNRRGLFRTVLNRLANSSDHSENWWIESARNNVHEFSRSVHHQLGLASRL